MSVELDPAYTDGPFYYVPNALNQLGQRIRSALLPSTGAGND